MILIESNLENIQAITEDVGDTGEKKRYLQGVFMEAEAKNRNGRSYDLKEMTREVLKVQNAASQGNHILGELDHPSGSLEVSLKNVSHKIVEMRMQGNQAIGKAEILHKTAAGQILNGLVESGVKVGVSSRARGQVNESTGKVSNFGLVTVDAVAMPSAHNAYPESIMEQLEQYRRGDVVNDLAEAVLHDKAAQYYFQLEMKKFINSLKV